MKIYVKNNKKLLLAYLNSELKNFVLVWNLDEDREFYNFDVPEFYFTVASKTDYFLVS